jgi:hypothetical protein
MSAMVKRDPDGTSVRLNRAEEARTEGSDYTTIGHCGIAWQVDLPHRNESRSGTRQVDMGKVTTCQCHSRHFSWNGLYFYRDP